MLNLQIILILFTVGVRTCQICGPDYQDALCGGASNSTSRLTESNEVRSLRHEHMPKVRKQKPTPKKVVLLDRDLERELNSARKADNKSDIGFAA